MIICILTLRLLLGNSELKKEKKNQKEEKEDEKDDEKEKEKVVYLE